MVSGYLVLCCDYESWKGVRVRRGFGLLRPEFITSMPIYVVASKKDAVEACREMNRQRKGIFVYYYLPVNLYGYEKNP